MKLIITLLLCILAPYIATSQTVFNEGSGIAKKKITISLTLTNASDIPVLEYSPMEVIMPPHQWKQAEGFVRNGTITWCITAVEPFYITCERLAKMKIATYLAEPGDSIVIQNDGELITFKGNGSAKYELKREIAEIEQLHKFPSNIYKISLSDFRNKLQQLHEKRKEILRAVEYYRPMLSAFAYRYFKCVSVMANDDEKLNLFAALKNNVVANGVNNAELCKIFDEAFYDAESFWARQLPDGFVTGSYSFIRMEVARKFDFDTDGVDSVNSQTKRRFLYYQQAKKTYRGLTLEKYLAHMLTRQTMKEIGIDSEIEKLLNNYYDEPGYPEYKQYVKNFERECRFLEAGDMAPSFELKDARGKLFRLEQLHGKVVLLNFWNTGCIECKDFAQFLEERFKDTNIVFVSVSVDWDTTAWKKGLLEKKYTGASCVNLSTGPLAEKHPVIKAYSVANYPSLFLINPEGRIVQNPLPGFRGDDAERLLWLITEQIVQLHDGPYLFYKPGQRKSAEVYRFEGNSVIHEKTGDITTVQTDMPGKVFDVRLKKKLVTEPCEFSGTDSLFVLSDIEGNFNAFRNLLQANKIIDSDFNWIFGRGHLVLCGDMFDRGNQVTECLWLIYSLEEKAKAASGYVHFILGNHEIMNLSGDTGYVRQKYLKNAALLKRPYSKLFGINSELGRWLRTKNIIEKIGGIVFVHGGISKELSDVPLSIGDFNRLARPWYDRESEAALSQDNTVKMLYDSRSKNKLSPFWYRSYYLDKDIKVILNNRDQRIDTIYKPTIADIEGVLQKYHACRLVTGHTIVADTISIHYDGKIINTDTRHAEGKSEALLIEGDHFYRVNDKGETRLLFIDDKSKITTGAPGKKSPAMQEP